MLDEWVSRAAQTLGLGPDVMNTGLVLDLARDAAHGVARPAAPLTTYLVGVAVGQGRSLDEAVAAVQQLITSWPAPAEQ